MKEANCAKDFLPLPPKPTNKALFLGCRIILKMMRICLSAY